MVQDIRFNKILAENTPTAVFGVLPEPSSPDSPYGKELSGAGLTPNVAYVGGSFADMRKLLRNPNLPPNARKEVLEAMRLIYGQEGINALTHEGIHEVLNRMGEIEASKMLDLTSPSLDVLDESGLATEPAMKNALEYAKLRESGQRIRNIMRKGGY